VKGGKRKEEQQWCLVTHLSQSRRQPSDGSAFCKHRQFFLLLFVFPPPPFHISPRFLLPPRQA
jgi:hypothetical protein